jgi:hypothetical protein
MAEEESTTPEWFTSSAAAKFLGVHMNHLRTIPANLLPYYPVGRNRRYLKSDLLAYMQSIRVSV